MRHLFGSLNELYCTQYWMWKGIAFRTGNKHSAADFHIETAHTCTHTKEHFIPGCGYREGEEKRSIAFG